MKLSKTIFFSGALATALLGTGCTGLMGFNQRHQSTSVVQFLYPDENQHVDKPTIPVLNLPLRVGVAWVPENSLHPSSNAGGVLTEASKVKLIEEISESFRALPFVESIEIIPSSYLRPKGGFTNVRQLQSMFGIDVIALISYDQVQFTDADFRSLFYWTVVGAYFVEGEKNKTHTLLDAVVYDIQSRKLLFRAPGTSEVKGLSTPINYSEELRRDGARGFQLASTNLVENLQDQLASFQTRVKNRPEEVQIVHRPGYKGKGSLGIVEAVFGLCLGGMGLWARKRKS